MRKFGCFFLACCVLIMLCSCKNSNINQISVADSGYVCRATVDYKELSLSAELDVAGGGIFSIEVIEPEVLSTLRFDFDNSNVSVSYQGLKNSIPLSLENMGFAGLINNVFLKLTTGCPVALQQGNGFVYDGEIDGYEFSVLLNQQGLPLELDIPRAELSATFSDWKYE